MGPDRYGELVAFLSCFYEVVLLDLGTGVAGPLAVRARARRPGRARDPPEWVTASIVLEALAHVEHDRTTVVLNKSLLRSSDVPVIEQRFRAQRLHRTVAIPYDEHSPRRLTAAPTRSTRSAGPRAWRSSSSGWPSPTNSCERERIEVFFKMLSAMVAADALNRRQREQQHRRWLEEQRFAAAPWAVRPPLPVQPTRAPASDAVDWSAPERPR